MKVKINLIKEQFISVKIQGELSVFDEQFELLRKELLAYSKLGIYLFFFDLTQVSYVDSSGVSLLIRVSKPALDQNTMICVSCENYQVRRMFTVSNVDQIIRFVSSKEEALEFFKLTAGFEPT